MLSPKGKKKRGWHSTGKNHYNWHGENGSYQTKHIWIHTHYGKANHCEKCDGRNAKRFEWANVSGEYKRNIKDYIQLCPSCHRLMDKGNHCKNGHEFTVENTRIRQPKNINSKPYRVCKKCQINYGRNYKLRNKQNNGKN